MAIYQIRTAPGEAISTRIATAIVDGFYRVIDEMNARATARVLSRLSDETLYDIGLTRGQIADVSRRG